MKILVTGGAGFIGSNYVRKIVNNELLGLSKVIVLDNLTYAGRRENLPKEVLENFEFVLGDICDEDLVNKIAKRVDVIINFAAESHVDRSIKNSKIFTQTNILGVHNLLLAAVASGVSRFIQVSTDEVYGSIASGYSTEADVMLPNSPYAASKASADLLARSFYKTHGLDVRITRSSNNFGPYQFPEKIIPLFTTRILKGKKVPIYGSGQNIRDWIHVSDNCIGIHEVLLNGKPGEIYNIGGGNEISNIDLTKCILAYMGKSEYEIEFVEDRLGHDLRYAVSSEKIRKTLGFKPRANFQGELQNTINWYTENFNWWENVVH